MNETTDRHIPSSRDAFDVVVVGGGPAGFAAAVAAAREGAETLLVEESGCLGGQGTNGLVGPFMKTLGVEGVYDELRDRLATMGGLRPEGEPWGRLAFDTEIMKYVMQCMAEEAGVRFLLFTRSAGAVLDGNRVRGVRVLNKAGLNAIGASVLIDCTGDGDVAAAAGAAFEKGDPEGHYQAVTLFFTIGGVDEDALAQKHDFWEHMDAYVQKEREAGRLNLPPYVRNPWKIWKGSTLARGEYSINEDTAVDVDGTDPWQLTEAMNESRKRVFELVDFFRRHMPGGKNIHLVKTGAMLGVRETRRFKGVETLVARDVVDGRKRPEDGICRGSFFLDVHDGNRSERAKDRFGRNAPPEDDWYEIPYGCLVPEAVDGLLLAGRCVSSDRYANGSLRIMPTCMGLGQAAGIAAAMCAHGKTEPRQVDVEALRKRLRERYGVGVAD